MNGETSGFVAILAILAVSTVAACVLVYGLRISWFRDRLLHGDRTARMVAMLPIVIPLAIGYAVLVRPILR